MSDDPVPGWRYGPVRYILNVEEAKAYRALRTDEERRDFIERFWAGIDPNPG